MAAWSKDPVTSAMWSIWAQINSSESAAVSSWTCPPRRSRKVLAIDHAEHATAVGDRADRRVEQAVGVLAQPARHVRGDHGHLAVGRIALVEQRERVRERLLAHVRDIDQHVVAHHRIDERRAELAEAGLRLREHEPVQPVGKERDRRRVGGHAAPEQMCHGDVGHPARCQLADVGGDLLRLGAEVEAALHGVDQRQCARLQAPFERRAVVRNRRPAVVTGDVVLDCLELIPQPPK